MAQTVKKLPAMTPGLGRFPAEGNDYHSSSLSWRIPWTEEPGGLYSPWGHKESDMTERLTHLHFHRVQYAVLALCNRSCMLVWADTRCTHTRALDTRACVSPWKHLAMHTRLDNAFAVRTWPLFLKIYLLAMRKILEFNLRKEKSP